MLKTGQSLKCLVNKNHCFAYRYLLVVLADDTNHSNDFADSQPADTPNGIDGQ
jgi:hypothetical protein